TTLEDNERIFTELILSIKRRHSEVKQLIRDQERAAVRRAEGRLKQLEQEIADLRKRDAELKQFLEIHPIHFLQRFPTAVPELTGLAVSSHLSFDAVVNTAFQLRDKLH
ncbi:hypothetical protein M9458_007430, partial [Cirrhinus mrigala]